MKIQGQSIGLPKPEVVVIPRGESQLVFKAAPILDFSAFDETLPRPKPEVRHYPDGHTETNYESQEYKDALDDWARKRSAWMVLKSLEATEGLEWETVKLDDSSTWPNYEDELQNSGLTTVEVAAIIEAVVKACGLDQAKIEQATKDFLAGQQETPDA